MRTLDIKHFTQNYIKTLPEKKVKLIYLVLKTESQIYEVNHKIAEIKSSIIWSMKIKDKPDLEKRLTALKNLEAMRTVLENKLEKGLKACDRYLKNLKPDLPFKENDLPF